MSVKPKRLDSVASLREGKPIYFPDAAPVEPAPAPAPVEPIKPAAVEPEPVKLVEPAPTPAPVEPVKPAVVEPELVKPGAPEPISIEVDEFDYLSVPGTRDSAAVTRAKIEGRRRKELEAEIERIRVEKENELAQLRLQIEEAATKAPVSHSYKFEDTPEFAELHEKVASNLRRLKLTSTDPAWVQQNYADMVHGFDKALAGSDEGFVEFRDTLSAKTGLDAGTLVTMLSEASELSARAEKTAAELEKRNREGTLNETFSTYDKSVKATASILEDFRSTLGTRAAADEGSVFEFMEGALKEEGGEAAFKRVQDDLTILLHGPQQYSSEQLAKLQATGADISQMSAANRKKAEERVKKLIPSVAAGLFVLSHFKDIYQKSKEAIVEDEGLEVLKSAGKTVKPAPAPAPEPEKEPSAMEMFLKRYAGR